MKTVRSSFKIERSLPVPCSNLHTKQFVGEEFEDTHRVYSTTYKDALIFSKVGIVQLRGRGIVPEFGSDPSQAAEMSSLKFLTKLKCKYVVAKKKEVSEAYFFWDIWGPHYYHWFVDVVPRLLILKELVGSVPLILPSWYFKPFIEKTLTHLGFEDVTYLNDNEVAKVDNLHVISRVAARDSNCPNSMRSIRKLFDFPNSAGELVYISREFAGTRRTVNEKEVQECLSSFGFKVYHFERLGFDEQMKVASSAKCIVSNHGAGLTNMIFMKAGTNIVELKTFAAGEQNCFYRLAESLELNYRCIFSNTQTEDFDTADLLIDIVELKENLINILDERETY